MPRIADSETRKDAVIKVRISYNQAEQIKQLAHKQKISLSEFIRQVLQAELSKPK